MKVSVVVATRDRATRLARLLDALREQTLVPHQVIVVDDGSTDSTPDVLSAEAWDVLTPVRQERSQGPAAARNRGIALATGDLIAFTDDDCVPAKDWVAQLASAAARVDVVQGRTSADPQAFAARGPWDHFMVTRGPDDKFSTCNIAYRRTLLNALGGFDPHFTGTAGGAEWGEDTDLGWRALEQGATVTYAPEAVVEHDVVSRGFRGYCLAGLRRQGVPRLLKKHPGYRGQLFAGVFLNPAHAWAPLTALGTGACVLLAPGKPAAAAVVTAVSWAPWLHFRLRVRPLPARRRQRPAVLCMLWFADLMEFLVVAAAAGRQRVLIV